MKIFKKILSILVLVMLIAGCSQSAQDAKKEGSSASTKATDSSPIQIQFWYGLGSVAGETMEEIISDFNSSQDKVIVTGVQQADYNETYQKVQAAVAANKPPAVFIGSKIKDMHESDMLEDLTPYLDERTPLDDYLEVFVKPSQIDGGLYALPAYGTTQVMYYRKDLMEQAGLDPKQVYSSWENIRKASKEIQEKGITKYGHQVMWGPENLIDIARSNGGDIISQDGKTVTINSSEWVDSWEFVRQMIFEDKSTKINSGGQGWEYWYATIDNVMNGLSMGYTGSSGDKGDLDFTKIDSIPQPGLNSNPAKPQAGAHSLLIPKSASEEEKKAAFDWIAYFTSPKVSAKWSMKIGYIPIRKSALEVAEYKAFLEKNPYAKIPYDQALTASPSFVDPTGGQIYDALSIAADKVELENVPAKKALDEAQKIAQEALDSLK